MDLVRQLRRKKGWSQQHLATAASIGRATVQRIEAGRMAPSYEIAMALADALGADAIRIRQHSGLASAVSRTMETTLQRDPTDNELQSLPLDVAAIFRDYSDSRRELTDAEANHIRAAQHFETVLGAFDDGPTSLEELRSLYEQRRAARRLALNAFSVAGEQLVAANTRFSESSLALTRLLLRFV